MKAAGILAIGAASAALVAIASCFPAFDFSPELAESGAPDASADATLAGADGAIDAPPTSPPGDAAADTRIDAPATFPPTPVAILGAAVIATETGNAQQQHLVFAKNSQRWWFFYIDADAKLLKTRWSIDFVTWTDGASLTLPMSHGNEGRNFSVAYRDFAGRDVIHAATSLHDPPKRVVWDTRATIAGSALTWETPVLVHDLDVTDNVDGGGLQEAGSQGGDSCDPDGVGVAIGADGRVYVATSWVSVPGCCFCDSNFGTSVNVDDGSAWSGGFQAPLLHYSVPGTTSSRQLVALGSGNLLAGWDTADTLPPSNETWAAKSTGAWTDESSDDPAYWVFPESLGALQVQEKNDWSFCRIDDGHVHALHRKYKLLADGGSTNESRVFEHFVFNGAGWTFAGTLADDVGVPGSGVALVTNGAGLLAATIGADAAGSIRYATWKAAGWSAWRSLVGPDGGADKRAYVTGTGCADPAHPAILWTQGATAPYQVVAVPASGLMP